ncbi:hypothetical protein Y032_0092g2585 [Ancylostoma ceylanicum]|uniref:Uncharacterized protein n=1 Tax=Ancylostoma ceylanicum TaxID=53326 RepID=A0A016TLW0_9BILA|nr:hypothetical protein Y032_0092g2585 [Ancylostoma ceylanicum]
MFFQCPSNRYCDTILFGLHSIVEEFDAFSDFLSFTTLPSGFLQTQNVYPPSLHKICYFALLPVRVPMFSEPTRTSVFGRGRPSLGSPRFLTTGDGRASCRSLPGDVLALTPLHIEPVMIM